MNRRWQDLHVLMVSRDRRLVAQLERMLRNFDIPCSAGTSLAGLDGEQATGIDVAIVDCRAGTEEPGATIDGFPLPVVAIIDPDQLKQAERVLEAGAGAILTEGLIDSSLQVALMTALAPIHAQRHSSRSTGDERDMEWLQAAARAMGLCETVEQTLTVAAEYVQRQLGYDWLRITLIDEQGSRARDWLEVDGNGSRITLTEHSIAADRTIPPPCVVHELVDEGKDYCYVTSTEEEAPLGQRASASDTPRELLAVAMRLGAQLVGWITIDKRHSEQYSGPERAPHLLAFAREAAIAICKAQLQAAAARRAQELATLREVSASVAAQRDLRARSEMSYLPN